MARRPRSVFPDEGFFHITSRGVDRCAISRDDADRMLWIGLRRHLFNATDLATHAYCLMPNHFHLVVSGLREQLSKTMHRLNGTYAQRFNDRHGRVGHLFQERFALRVVENDEHFAAACDYVRANPVRAGLCAKPAEWPWGGG